MENPQPDPSASSALDLHYYLRILMRRRWLILAVWATVFCAVSFHTLRQPKIFGGAVSIIIDAQAPRVLDNQSSEVLDNGTGTYWFNKEYYETQYKVITSRAVSQRVVEKLGLHSDPEFLGVSMLPEPQRTEAMRGADAIGQLQSMIQVVPAKDSRLVFIIVEDVEPERAALLSNAVAEAFIDENLALKLRATESASRWLEERLGDLEVKSKTSELAVYSFKKDSDMLTSDLENRLNTVSQRLSTYDGALTEVRTRIAALRAKVDAIQSLRESVTDGSEHWGQPLGVLVGASLLDTLKLRFVNQRAECAELKDRYLEKHPAQLGCEVKLEAARGDLFREIDSRIRAAELELNQAENNERNLVALVASTKAEAFEVNKKQIEFEQLQRDADNNRRLHEQVLKRLSDIELSGLLRTSNVRILDAARPSLVPVRPRVKRELAFALVLGLAVALAFAVVLEYLDNTVSSQADVEGRLGLPFIGLLPALAKVVPEGSDRDLHVHRQPKSTSAEFARAIRTNLLFMAPDRPLGTLLVTSCNAQEGKSTTTITLGTTMAQSGQRVLLIDTDMRRPRLHKALGVPNEVGVSSVVAGVASVESAVKATEVPNLWLLPCGPIPPNPAELLHTNAFRAMVRELAKSYDRIILDSPPLSPVADAAVLSAQVDGVILVLKAGRTSREMARRAVRSILDVNGKLLGVLLNDVRLSDPKYGYNYYYDYQASPYLSEGNDGARS